MVKILRQDLAADDSAQKRFLREARLATQIKHPNVAILYDFALLPEGSFYMVWEHIEGEDVGEFLRKHGPAPVPVGIELGIQALRGLEAIHTTGVIHRDISPDNVMITRDRRGRLRVKIIDLGLARNLERDTSFEITQVGMFMGKLQYCSPEQAGTISGESLDRRSDLYSFAPGALRDDHRAAAFRLGEPERLHLQAPLRGPAAARRPQPAHRGAGRARPRGQAGALERDRDRRYPDAVSFITDLERVGIGLRAAETKEIPVTGARAAAAARAGGHATAAAAQLERAVARGEARPARPDRARRRAHAGDDEDRGPGRGGARRRADRPGARAAAPGRGRQLPGPGPRPRAPAPGGDRRRARPRAPRRRGRAGARRLPAEKAAPPGPAGARDAPRARSRASAPGGLRGAPRGARRRKRARQGDRADGRRRPRGPGARGLRGRPAGARGGRGGRPGAGTGTRSRDRRRRAQPAPLGRRRGAAAAASRRCSPRPGSPRRRPRSSGWPGSTCRA